MLTADVIPAPLQLYVTGVVVVVALAFTEVRVQFNAALAALATTGTVVF
jgi:hypothetical protein